MRSFLGLLIVIFVLTINGQNNNSVNNSKPSNQEIQQVEKNPSSEENVEVKILRAQLEIMKEYNERILNTIYWALGGIITVVLVVAFLGWYSNFNVHKKDVETLKKEVESISILKISELGEILKSSLQDQQKISLGNLDKSLTDRISISERHLDALDKLWKSMTIEIERLSAKDWEERKVYVNAISSNSRLIEMASKLGWKESVISALGEIERLLKLREEEVLKLNAGLLPRIIGTQPVLGAEATVKLTEILDHLPLEYQSNIDEIYKLLGVTRNRIFPRLPAVKPMAP